MFTCLIHVVPIFSLVFQVNFLFTGALWDMINIQGPDVGSQTEKLQKHPNKISLKHTRFEATMQEGGEQSGSEDPSTVTYELKDGKSFSVPNKHPINIGRRLCCVVVVKPKQVWGPIVPKKPVCWFVILVICAIFYRWKQWRSSNIVNISMLMLIMLFKIDRRGTECNLFAASPGPLFSDCLWLTVQDVSSPVLTEQFLHQSYSVQLPDKRPLKLFYFSYFTLNSFRCFLAVPVTDSCTQS